jgi:hypothetical protein
LSSLKQATAGGAWTRTWLDLGGTDLQDGLTTVVGPQGRIDVFASTRTSLLRWTQSRPNDPIVRDPAFAGAVPASPPQAALDRQGRITVAYRRASTATIAVSSQVTVGGAWQTPIDLGGSGTTAPALVLSPPGPAGRLMMFARDSLGGVSTSRQLLPAFGFSPWAALSDDSLDSPAAILDASGRVAVFAIGTAGLSVQQQAVAGPDQPFGERSDLGL